MSIFLSVTDGVIEDDLLEGTVLHFDRRLSPKAINDNVCTYGFVDAQHFGQVLVVDDDQCPDEAHQYQVHNGISGNQPMNIPILANSQIK